VHPTTPEKGQNSAPKPSKRPLKKATFLPEEEAAKSVTSNILVKNN
jgi:hypothetical protein